jgi:histidine decarboxylase
MNSALEIVLARLKEENKRVVIVANIGTTLKGAVDDVDKILSLLESLHFTNKEFFLHLDGALFGMMLPFVHAEEKRIADEDGKVDNDSGAIELFAHKAVTFNKPGVGSISVSGHKFLGCPVPCGIVITRKQYIDRLSQDISYIASRDATILGSRNGHAPIFMWYALVKKGKSGIAQDILNCVENAKYMRDQLIMHKVEKVLVNQYSCTVVFERPTSEDFVKKWQLACDRDLCHVVVMPNVDKVKIDEFILDLIASEWTNISMNG